MSTVALTPATVTRLEKAAADNGFDQELPRQGDWLGFASTRAPLQIWLTAVKDALFLAAVSQQNVARALGEHGAAFASPLPQGACGARGVADGRKLHHGGTENTESFFPPCPPCLRGALLPRRSRSHYELRG